MNRLRHPGGFLIWVGVYAVLLIAAVKLLDLNVITALPLRVIVALIPMIGGIGILTHTMSEYRRSDELQQKITAEGIMFAFGVTAIVTFAYGFLQRFVGAPDVSYFAVWGIMGFAWLAGGLLARYRYR